MKTKHFDSIVKLFLILIIIGNTDTLYASRLNREPLHGWLAKPADAFMGKLTVEKDGVRVVVNSVIKGSDSLMGKIIDFKHRDYQLVHDGQIIDGNDTLVIVPYSSGQLKIKNDEAGAVYFRPAIRLLQDVGVFEVSRIIVELMNMKESERLSKLLVEPQTYANQNLQKYFLDNLRHMRKHENFSIILSSFSRADEKLKIKLINLMKYIRDQRAIPILIESLDSDSLEIRRNAAQVLFYRFYHVPEVIAAFKRLRKTEGLEWLIDKLKYGAAYKRPTVWQLLLNTFNGSRDIDLLKDFSLEETNYLPLRFNAYQLYLKHASPKEVDVFCDQWESSMSRKLNDKNYYATELIMEKSRKIKQCDHSELFVQVLLSKPDFIMRDALIQSIFAISELKEESRISAIKMLVETINKESSSSDYVEMHYRLSSLFWLENCDFLTSIKSQLNLVFLKYWDSHFNVFCSTNTQTKDNTVFENLLYKDLTKVHPFLLRMFITKIEELALVQGEGFMLNHLAQAMQHNRNITIKALTKIKGEKTVSKILELMEHSSLEYRRFATDAIIEMLKKESLPYLRKAAENNNYGHAIDAFLGIGRYGEKSDIALLESHCNFWDRKNESIYFPCLALDLLNERFYD